MDRIAIHVFVRPVELSAFASESPRETSAEMRSQVAEARERQKHRLFREGLSVSHVGPTSGGAFDAAPLSLNARLPERLVKMFCRLDDAGDNLLVRAQKQLRVSARGRGHLLRVARTIADLEGSNSIRAAHVAEAVQYRMRETGD
jgi:magnesium chelatase family protein